MFHHFFVIFFIEKRKKKTRARTCLGSLCTVKNLSFGGWVCFAIAGEEGIQEVRAPSFLATEVPQVLEDDDGKLRWFIRYQWGCRRRQRRQGLRLAQHLVESIGADDGQLRIVASCRLQCGYNTDHITAEQSQQPDSRL